MMLFNTCLLLCLAFMSSPIRTRNIFGLWRPHAVIPQQISTKSVNLIARTLPDRFRALHSSYITSGIPHPRPVLFSFSFVLLPLALHPILLIHSSQQHHILSSLTFLPSPANIPDLHSYPSYNTMKIFVGLAALASVAFADSKSSHFIVAIKVSPEIRSGKI